MWSGLTLMESPSAGTTPEDQTVESDQLPDLTVACVVEEAFGVGVLEKQPATISAEPEMMTNIPSMKRIGVILVPSNLELSFPRGTPDNVWHLYIFAAIKTALEERQHDYASKS